MEQIKPAHVTFEQAKKLKEKGFNEICFSWYSDVGDRIFYGAAEIDFKAPEQWQVVEWLRINHGIWISIQIGHDENKVWYNVYLEKIELTYEFEPINNDFDIGGDTPQEAYSAAFDYILRHNLI